MECDILENATAHVDKRTWRFFNYAKLLHTLDYVSLTAFQPRWTTNPEKMQNQAGKESKKTEETSGPSPAGICPSWEHMKKPAEAGL